MSLEREVAGLRQELDTIEQVNASLREQLDRVHTDNNTLTDENAFIRKKVSSLQQEITNNHNEYSRIETELYQQGQEVERLKKENVGFLKNKRESERKLREETIAFEKDRQSWHEREGELVSQLKALQETVGVLAQQSVDSQKKHSQSGSNDSPPPSPTTSLHNAAREAKIAQRTIKEQDRLIFQLKTEIEKAKSATTDSLNLNKNLSLKITLLENELEQVKRMKRSLEEENEAFQLLLHEKTMKGEFMLNPIMQRNDSPRRDSTRASKDITGESGELEVHGPTKRERKVRPKSIVTDLAAELDRASAGSVAPYGERVQKESDQSVDFEKLQEEIKGLKDENKSLKLYIQKILDRIMEAQGFEEILSTDWSKRQSNPPTPTATTFSHTRTTSKPVNSVTVVPTTNEQDAAAALKKVERRKTLSGPFRFMDSKKLSNSKPPGKDPVPEEKSDQLSPLPASPTLSRGNSLSEAFPSARDPPRHQRRNSTSEGGARKRWSMWWSGNPPKQEEKKEDPYMRPMILVQEKTNKD